MKTHSKKEDKLKQQPDFGHVSTVWLLDFRNSRLKTHRYGRTLVCNPKKDESNLVGELGRLFFNSIQSSKTDRDFFESIIQSIGQLNPKSSSKIFSLNKKSLHFYPFLTSQSWIRSIPPRRWESQAVDELTDKTFAQHMKERSHRPDPTFFSTAFKVVTFSGWKPWEHPPYGRSHWC